MQKVGAIRASVFARRGSILRKATRSLMIASKGFDRLYETADIGFIPLARFVTGCGWDAPRALSASARCSGASGDVRRWRWQGGCFGGGFSESLAWRFGCCGFGWHGGLMGLPIQLPFPGVFAAKCDPIDLTFARASP